MRLPTAGEPRGKGTGGGEALRPCQHPSAGIIPARGQKRRARTRPERGESRPPPWGWCFPRIPSTQALAPRLPRLSCLSQNKPWCGRFLLCHFWEPGPRKLRGKARAGGADDSARVPIPGTSGVSRVPARAPCRGNAEPGVRGAAQPELLAPSPGPARSCP